MKIHTKTCPKQVINSWPKCKTWITCIDYVSSKYLSWVKIKQISPWNSPVVTGFRSQHPSIFSRHSSPTYWKVSHVLKKWNETRLVSTKCLMSVDQSPWFSFISLIVELTVRKLPDHHIVLTIVLPRGGGGGYSLFFCIRRLRFTPKNIRNFKHPKKIFEILAAPKNIPILYHDLKKDPKMHRNDP